MQLKAIFLKKRQILLIQNKNMHRNAFMPIIRASITKLPILWA